ncbi:MAG TPA: FHA domain-containing protein [Paenibacillaceae bacterium]
MVAIVPLAAQWTTGDLPIAAALLIGVAVAAVAVAAFLRLTRSARRTAIGEQGQGSPSMTDSEQEFAPERVSAPEPDPAPERDAAPEMEAALDKTIPLRALSVDLPREEGSGEGRGEPQLFCLSGDFSGRRFRVGEQPLSLGRDPTQCSLVFRTDAAEISRKHCSLSYHKGKGIFLLLDHGSSNGTYLRDGRRLEPHKVYELRPGDRFFLSGNRHEFEVRIVE